MKFFIFAILGLLVATGCASRSQVEQTIRDNPEIVFEAIKKHPARFMEAVRIAAQTAQEEAYADREKQMSQQMEKDFKNPRQVNVDSKKILSGPDNAPITIIKYADFQCPACRMGFETLEKIKEKYKGQVRMIHKNIPLPMHPLAPLAAQIYEALLYTDKAKALAFYKKTYSEQGKWKTEKDLWQIAKSVGANQQKIQAEIKKGDVDKSIQTDLEEHSAQGFQGTPAYVINGVALYGAQPEEEFSAVIDRLLKK